MVEVPCATDNASPSCPIELLTVATLVADELHTAEEVSVCVVLSLYVPTAANCSVFPKATPATNGVTAIETSVAGVDVIAVDPLTPLRVDVIVKLPVFSAVTKPGLDIDVPTEAIDVSEEDQLAELVRSRVERSEYVPVTWNWSWVPFARLDAEGVTASETSVAGLTVKVAELVTPLRAAVMLLDPELTAVATPALPELLLTVATAGVPDVHVTDPVRSWVAPSEYVPVAANCCVRPAGVLWRAGVMPMETRLAAVTVRVNDPVTPLAVAEMMVVPGDTGVTKPLESIVATAVFDDDQVTVPVTSCFVPSSRRAVLSTWNRLPTAAVFCRPLPAGGATDSDVTFAVSVSCAVAGVGAWLLEQPPTTRSTSHISAVKHGTRKAGISHPMAHFILRRKSHGGFDALLWAHDIINTLRMVEL
jgi:hypothetical protein